MNRPAIRFASPATVRYIAADISNSFPYGRAGSQITDIAARRCTPGLLIALAVSLGPWACGSQPVVLRLGTTTSVENSGLLGAILPPFERQHGVRIDVLTVGSGQALNLLERGDVDVGLTHDPRAEAAALEAAAITGYRKIMFNDFIVAGPRGDPAGVADASSAVEAFRRIAVSRALFASRGDASGTHARELELWKLAVQRPPADRLLEVGQRMSATLRVASERGAYTLTDRATFTQLQPDLQLVASFEGGPELLNTYAIFLRAGVTGTERELGTELVEWLADGEGRQLVAGFLIDGRPVFRVWPPGRPRRQPFDLPDAR